MFASQRPAFYSSAMQPTVGKCGNLFPEPPLSYYTHGLPRHRLLLIALPRDDINTTVLASCRALEITLV